MIAKVRFLTSLVVAMGVLSACAPAAEVAAPTQPAATEAPTATTDMGMDMGMEMGEAPSVPAGLAYAEGEEIRFIHTEASDAEIAGLLTDMMSSPVLHVPSLVEIPESATAIAYVFANGPEGMGPLGFQVDGELGGLARFRGTFGLEFRGPVRRRQILETRPKRVQTDVEAGSPV